MTSKYQSVSSNVSVGKARHFVAFKKPPVVITCEDEKSWEHLLDFMKDEEDEVDEMEINWPKLGTLVKKSHNNYNTMNSVKSEKELCEQLAQRFIDVKLKVNIIELIEGKTTKFMNAKKKRHCGKTMK